jgi:hypothetical protein
VLTGGSGAGRVLLDLILSQDRDVSKKAAIAIAKTLIGPFQVDDVNVFPLICRGVKQVALVLKQNSSMTHSTPGGTVSGDSQHVVLLSQDGQILDYLFLVCSKGLFATEEVNPPEGDSQLVIRSAQRPSPELEIIHHGRVRRDWLAEWKNHGVCHLVARDGHLEILHHE